VHILLLNEYFPPDTSATAKFAAQVGMLSRRGIASRCLRAVRAMTRPSAIRVTSFAGKLAGILAVERVGSTPIRGARCASEFRTT